MSEWEDEAINKRTWRHMAEHPCRTKIGKVDKGRVSSLLQTSNSFRFHSALDKDY